VVLHTHIVERFQLLLFLLFFIQYCKSICHILWADFFAWWTMIWAIRRRCEKTRVKVIEDKIGLLIAKVKDAESSGRLSCTNAEEGQISCIICVIHIPNVMFFPCSHASFCHDCIIKEFERQRVFRITPTCSYCCTRIENVMFPQVRGFHVLNTSDDSPMQDCEEKAVRRRHSST
jgi:hypothetical protein